MSGCPIPSVGTLVTRAICLPDTWAGLISESLVPQTDEGFWDNQATLADREAATKIASEIVGSFLSPDCECNPPPGTYHRDSWDFTVSDGGWEAVGPGYGTYGDGKWNGDVVQLGANDWMIRLQIRKQYSPDVVPREMKATCRTTDSATTHIDASYASCRAGTYFPKVTAEVQFGGTLTEWHNGPINPRFVVYTNEGISYIEIGMSARFALDPSGVVFYWCIGAYFDWYG